MLDREQRSWGRKVINTELTGGVSAGRELKRARGLKGLFGATEPVEPELGAELQSTTQDFYPKTGTRVSIEGASHREQDLKDALDGRTVANNLGWDEEGSNGLVPCDLLERQRGRRR